MDITYLGHSSFKLRGKQGTVVTDPFDPQIVGLKWNNPKADVITISHQHQDHNFVKGVSVSNSRKDQGIFIVNGPGEYEISDIMIHGWASYHDNELGSQRGNNTIFLIELDRVRILHLGDLGHELSEKTKEEIGQVDILLIPVGGTYTIDAKTAVKITKSISPSIVIPMHYQTSGLNPQTFSELKEVDEFVKELDLPSYFIGSTSSVQTDAKSENKHPDKLSVSTSTLPEDSQIAILKSV